MLIPTAAEIPYYVLSGSWGQSHLSSPYNLQYADVYDCDGKYHDLYQGVGKIKVLRSFGPNLLRFFQWRLFSFVVINHVQGSINNASGTL